MAVRYAVVNGNWSAVGTWDGGASLPTAGDDVYANGFTVTIDQDIEVNKISTEVCPTTSIGGGSFYTSLSGLCIIANIIPGTTTCLDTQIPTQGTITIIGDIYGGDATQTSVYGVYFGVLSNRKMQEAANHEIKVMHTKCVSADEGISSLSGGNQQKVIIGKWLEREPDVFLMDEPTRGIDVGAKFEIYQLIIKMAKEGKTIIVVSSEMPEILGITNRIAVMSNHKMAGIVNTKETDQETLLRLSAKYL